MFRKIALAVATATVSVSAFAADVAYPEKFREGRHVKSMIINKGHPLYDAVGAILTHVVNPQAFHWRMELQIPWLQVLPGAALTLAAGVIASRFAARQATRLPAAQVLASAQ